MKAKRMAWRRGGLDCQRGEEREERGRDEVGMSKEGVFEAPGPLRAMIGRQPAQLPWVELGPFLSSRGRGQPPALLDQLFGTVGVYSYMVL